MFDKFKDECGVFGVYGHAEASKLTYLGLYSLQHRGQESAGIASADGDRVRVVKKMGYDGVELACWGDHFDVEQAASSKKYVANKWALLKDHGLTCYAVSNHLVGQAICDHIDDRHKSIVPDTVWGDGDPEGVRKRAAKHMATAMKAARAFQDARPGRKSGDATPAVVNGFTGSSIWHSIYAFPPTNQNYWDKGFADFAKRFGPILEAAEAANVNFGLEVHPTEIAFDIASAARAKIGRAHV